MPAGRPPKSKIKPVPKADIGKIEEEKTQEPKLYCLWCGSDKQNNFYLTKDKHRKFFGKIPYCKDCIQLIYAENLKKYNKNPDLALYYTLRKIDAPYIRSAYTGAIENVNNPRARIQGEENLIKAYMKNLAFSEANGWGYTFDDSLGEKEINGLASYDEVIKVRRRMGSGKRLNDEYDIIEIDSDELVQKWGLFEDDDLAYLESEYMDWDEQLNGISDKNTEIMVKQICLRNRAYVQECA